MGTKQLLLIVLGVIIVGFAILSGINMFKQSSRNYTIEQTLLLHNKLMDDAWVYFKTPSELSGGGNSFEKWTPSSHLIEALEVVSEIEGYYIRTSSYSVLFTTSYDQIEDRIWIRSSQFNNGWRYIYIRDYSSGYVKFIEYFINR